MDWTPIHFWSKDALKDTDSCISDIVSFIIENENMDDIVEKAQECVSKVSIVCEIIR